MKDYTLVHCILSHGILYRNLYGITNKKDSKTTFLYIKSSLITMQFYSVSILYSISYGLYIKTNFCVKINIPRTC